MKRVGIAGFLHESNTFSPISTTRQHFEQSSLTKGKALVERWRGSHHELGGFLEGAKAYEFLPIPLMATYAIPGGAITSGSFNQLAAEMIDALKAALPLDGLLMALHGATVAENFPDADGEMAYRFRQVLGPRVPIVMTLDLHANVSPQMVSQTNAAVLYRSNPHLDQKQRGLEAAELMSQTLRGMIHPVQAVERPPFIIK